MRRFGLPDVLGVTAVLVAIVWIPGAADPLTYAKLLFLAAGGLAAAPAAGTSGAQSPRRAVT